MRYKTAVFIGRFQPVHSAHIKIIQEALTIADKVIISVGTAKRARTIKNPWSTLERISLIKDALREELDIEKLGWTDYPDDVDGKITFITARDHKYNDTKWASEVYSKAVNAGATQDKDTVLIGCFKDHSSFYLKMFPQWSFHETERVYSHGRHLLNATDIRDEMFETQDCRNHFSSLAKTTVDSLRQWTLSSSYQRLQEEFEHITKYRAAWSAAPYQPTFVTTDAVVIKSGHILLVKRGFNPGKGLWALPGGFLDPKEKIEDCAIRELKEETRIQVDKPVLKRSILESKVFDHPERSLKGRTITHAYLIDLEEGPLPYVKGSDDAVGAHWVPLADLQSIEDEIFEDHMDIITHMTSRF